MAALRLRVISLRARRINVIMRRLVAPRLVLARPSRPFQNHARKPNPNRALVIASVMAIQAMVAIEATIVSTAMPQIVTEQGGLNLYSCVLVVSADADRDDGGVRQTGGSEMADSITSVTESAIFIGVCFCSANSVYRAMRTSERILTDRSAS
jgi:hypothetical protein